MHRHAVLNEYSVYIDPMVPDDESLLTQLCEHLHRSGFLFDDASEAELRRGEEVIRDFFEQEAAVLQSCLPRKRLQQFMAYMRGHKWDEQQLRDRLRLKVMKGFERFARGTHHQFNIRFALARGLREKKGGPLQDFLLNLEAYHSLLLKGRSGSTGRLLDRCRTRKSSFPCESGVPAESLLSIQW